MARELYWKRVPNVSFDFSHGTESSEHLLYVLPGETLIRLDLYVRPWSTGTFPGGILNDGSLVVPYGWGLFYDNGTVPNPTIRYPLSSANTLPNDWLWNERFIMRDGWTPASYNGVNIGFTWDRVDCNITTKTRRANPVTSTYEDDIRFTWEAFGTGPSDPLDLTWKVAVAGLFLGPDV